MRRFFIACSAAAFLGGMFGMHTPVSADSVKIVGCLVRGEGGSGYLLINPPADPAASSRDARVVTPSAVGTTAAFSNLFYWLDDDDDLRPHVGHRIEVEGEVEGDIKAGEIEIDRKKDWTEIEVKSGGRELKARVPNTSIVAPPNSDRTMDILVRRVEADKVKMLDAVCR